MVSEIRPLTDPSLNVELPEFDFSKHDAAKVKERLVETLKAHPEGLGLSANQIGMMRRAFVMRMFDVSTGAEEFKVFFNPTVRYSSQEDYLEEGCLSNPGLGVKIRRPSNIRVSYQDENGQLQTAQYIGMTARCFLHELDHLNGINYLERATKYHLDQAKKRYTKLKRLIKKASKVRYESNSFLDMLD